MTGLGVSGLARRSACLQALRRFFVQRGYLEVDTPIRQPVLLPEANIIPFAVEDWWLHASPEQCMKRLLARGASRIFQICHCFRKEEDGRLHQGEFAMLEWYQTGGNYQDLMAECEALLAFLGKELAGIPALSFAGLKTPQQLRWQDKEIDLTPPWERLTVHEAFRHYAGITPEEALAKDQYEEILVERIEPHLGRKKPTFLCDYPKALGSLARKSLDNPDIAERFELYAFGLELANGFSELTDTKEQRARFTEEIKAIQAQGRDAAMPERFLEALEQMPAAAGIALGVDRLFMLLADLDDIRKAIPFPAESL